MNEQIKALLKAETGDAPASVKLAIASETAQTPAEVWSRIDSFAPNQGWLCLTDKVLSIYEKTDIPLDRTGIILSGELVNGSESLHIRQSENGWALRLLKAGEGDDCVMFKKEYVSTENSQQARLLYEVCWKCDSDRYRPWAARFAGIVKEVK